MIVLLSPAKDLTDAPVPGLRTTTHPRLLERSAVLVEKLRGMSVKKLGTLMGISPALAELNHVRYQEWGLPFTRTNALPAMFTFNGEVYRGLGARTLEAGDLRFAQEHLRILSGLYGLLRPLDLIRAYRLEMGTKLAMGRGVRDLYSYWGDRITELINSDLAASRCATVVNLASAEYFKAVRPGLLTADVVIPVFKDRVAGDYKVVMVFAKQQRGAMARHIVRYRMLDAGELKSYTGGGYRYSAERSTASEWVFLRDTR